MKITFKKEVPVLTFREAFMLGKDSIVFVITILFVLLGLKELIEGFLKYLHNDYPEYFKILSLSFIYFVISLILCITTFRLMQTKYFNSFLVNELIEQESNSITEQIHEILKDTKEEIIEKANELNSYFLQNHPYPGSSTVDFAVTVGEDNNPEVLFFKEPFVKEYSLIRYSMDEAFLKFLEYCDQETLKNKG